jgi:hypothetical protein
VASHKIGKPSSSSPLLLLLLTDESIAKEEDGQLGLGRRELLIAFGLGQWAQQMEERKFFVSFLH